MSDTELIRIAVSYLIANLSDVEEAMDITIDYAQASKVEDNLYKELRS